MATIQGKPVGVRHGRVTYFATEWPHFAGLPESWINQDATVSTPCGCVLFAYQRGEEKLLAGVGRQARPVTETVNRFGFRLRLENCTSFVVGKTGDRATVLFSEGKVEAQ